MNANQPNEKYMKRCLQLAGLGAGMVAPNPLVGAVLVHNNRIIGEGYHQRYGEAHAEVNCLNAVQEQDRPLISASTLYVSLEPCAHHGKTPPCADLIVQSGIRRVVVAVRDPFSQVNGRGIDKLKAASVNVVLGMGEEEALYQNRRFFCFQLRQRPYIILKWAQTRNGFIAPASRARMHISAQASSRLVHKWRSEEAAILVGTNTALYDNPELSNRYWPGPSPVRLVLDRQLRLPESLKLFSGSQPTIVLTQGHRPPAGNVSYETLDAADNLPLSIVRSLYRLNLQSVLVEGGARMLQSFIDAGLWDEARVITGNVNLQQSGLPAPILKNARLLQELSLEPDHIQFYIRNTQAQ